jgi:hypothetical protein
MYSPPSGSKNDRASPSPMVTPGETGLPLRDEVPHAAPVGDWLGAGLVAVGLGLVRVGLGLGAGDVLVGLALGDGTG